MNKNKSNIKQDGTFSIVLCFIICISIISCKEEIVSEEINFEEVPIQVVENLQMMQSKNGDFVMQMVSPRMERYQYEKDSILQSYEIYPDSFFVFGYTKDGALETTVVAQTAKHITTRDKQQWIVYGDVEITNYLNNQKMFSDTIYWDQENQRIYTDCYVRLENNGDVMQGYGMESDEMARSATILRPFDSFTVILDSATRANAPFTSLDSVNFMGPFPK